MLIKIVPSVALLLFFILMHLIASLCVVFTQLPMPITLSILFFIVLSFCYFINRYYLMQSKNSIVELEYNANDNWRLLTGTGKTIAASLSGNSYISEFIIILNFNCEQKIFTIPVIILPFMLTNEQLRNLRMFLLFASEKYA